jgi:hypothetical protein
VTDGAWATTPPYTEAAGTRWLLLTWAAREFKISVTALRDLARAGTVEAKQKPSSGHWLVSECSLRQHLFGSPDARS